MKKILLSLFTLFAIGGLTYGAAQSFFTDTEKSAGNSFTTGTIDISVDGVNPWIQNFAMNDMKPSQVDYINFVVKNVGSNPVNLFKTLDNFAEVENRQSQSKCLEIKGNWDGTSCSGGNLPTDMESTIRYDLRVELYKSDPKTPTEGTKPYWWETIYQDSDNIRVGALPAKMFLGMIPVGHYMKVIQSYHMDSDTGNAYQGEKLTFDITLNAEQLKGTLVLEDKYEPNTDVSHHVWLAGGQPNGKDATLIYGVKDDAFNYTLNVKGMADGQYTLVSWVDDPALQWTWGSFAGTTVLANITVASGTANVTGSIDLNKDLKNAKVWLVPGNWGTPGSTGVSLPWDPGNTLFDTGLIDYYDSVI